MVCSTVRRRPAKAARIRRPYHSSATTRVTIPAARATPGLDYLLPAIGTANVLAVATVALFVVPRYMDMFSAFGADLPAGTRLMLARYRGWALLALMVPLVWLVWPDPRTRGAVGLIAGSLLAVLLIAFGLWARYAPIVALAVSAP